MRATRKVNRRSFVASVVGGTILGGGAVALVTGEAGAQNIRYSGVTDCDSGGGADRPGYGVGQRNQVSDSDTGPNSDPRCHGRGTSNSGTQYHRDYPATGCSDRDYGPNGDVGGQGIGCQSGSPTSGGRNPYVSGCSDSDPASNGDPIGNGRHCTPR